MRCTGRIESVRKNNKRIGMSKVFEKIEESNKSSIEKIKSLRNEPIKKSTQFVMAFLGVLFMLFALGLFVLEVVKGVLALFLVALTIVAGISFFKFIREADPIIQQKIRNRKIAIMMKEARSYAIEQLQNEVLRKTQLLIDKKKSRDKLGSMVAQMKSALAQEKPDSKIANQMRENLTSIEANYNKFQQYLEKENIILKQYEEEVEGAKKLDQFNTVASEFLSLMSETTETKLEEMLSVESFRAIDMQFHENTVAMDNLMNDMELK